MCNSSTVDLLKVLLGHKSVPVRAQPLLVEVGVHQLSVGVLIHNLVQVVPNVHLREMVVIDEVVHLFKELGCDPWFKKKPASSVHPSDLAILAIKASGWRDKEEGENWENGRPPVHAGLQDMTGLTTPTALNNAN